MKKLPILILLLLPLLVGTFLQAGELPQSFQEAYELSAAALEQTLNEFKATEPGQGNPLISSMGEALLQLLRADSCHRIYQEDIYDMAALLFKLIQDLSYPCTQEEPAYLEAQEMSQVVATIRTIASWGVFFNAPVRDLDAAKMNAVDENPPSCTVRLEVYLGEILRVPLWLHPGELGKALRVDRFSEWRVRAVAYPPGGSLEISAVEQDGYPVNNSASPYGSPQEVGKEILDRLIKLKTPLPDGFFAVDVKATYAAPNGASCKDMGTILIAPPQ